MLEKTNLLLLSKEATEEKGSLKTHLLLSTNSQSSGKISRDTVWRKQGFFSDERADFNLEKRNFPENALCYINQEYAVKGGELAIYNHVFILGQLTVAANQPKDIETYDCTKNEAKLISCLYDQLTAEVLGQS